ncbi:acid phosphatase [Fusarium beomiforme]|uniref:Acid phosphatase n=1 Tax=Fusarium beomiforme TaxID=44412 RepID=A0A9P5AXU9_9HYPO|nr:acid phosphatase [Fusarium beomiforme]
MSGLPTGASSSEAMAMNFGSAHSQSMTHLERARNLDLGASRADINSDGAALQTLPFGTSYDLDAFSSTFEDPFSYSTRQQFDHPPNQDALHEESSPQEPDNKLLGFSAPVSNATFVNENNQFVEAGMTAELYGMFFVAEDVFGGESSGRPMELTCYRRNLWQCSGQITLPRVIRNIVNEQGQHIQIFELIATIAAIESIEGKATEIISIPWKNANPQGGDDSKGVSAPPAITLDITTGQEIDAHRVSLPISWKRLQFKHATANNGRRKGLQQHYVVKITLLGKTQAGELIKISEIQSGPVIVRGRSPRNFDSRKDVPLTGDKRFERRSASTSNVDHPTLKLERENSTNFTQKFPPAGNLQPNDWATPGSMTHPLPSPQPAASPHPAKRVALSPTMTRPPIPAWSSDSNSSAKAANSHSNKNSIPRQNTSLPINLSLSEDERSPNRSSTELHSPNSGKGYTTAGANRENSPADEGADPLYEYFPLTVDDWMPPVDAVYRPHVVHHTIMPPEMKAQQLKSKAKRYFASD